MSFATAVLLFNALIAIAAIMKPPFDRTSTAMCAFLALVDIFAAWGVP
jgi:hypothetical protein